MSADGGHATRAELEALRHEFDVSINRRVGPIETIVIELPVEVQKLSRELAEFRMDVVNLKGALEAQKRAFERLLVALERPKRRKEKR